MLSRIIAVLFVASFLWTPLAWSQIALLNNNQLTQDLSNAVSPDELDYYLYQAVAAPRQELRIRLNHLGLFVSTINGAYYVSAVLNSYPAHSAGLRRGDRLGSVDGAAFHPLWSFNAERQVAESFTANIRPYTLTLMRNEVAMQLQVTPVYENLYDSLRSATSDSLQFFVNGNKLIAYVHLWSLGLAWSDLISYQELIRDLDHSDGLIIDVRDAYGLLAAEHLDKFFPSRASYPLITPQDENGIYSNVPAQINSPYYGRAMVVMHNAATRGGMELFAYQLGKLPRVMTVGSNSAGKMGYYRISGSEQQLTYVHNSTMLIDGKNLEGEGLVPDVSMPYEDTSSAPSDPQFDAAIAALMGII